MAQHDLDNLASPTAATALTATLPPVPPAATAAGEVFGIPELLGMIIGHVIVLEEAMADAEDAALKEPDNQLFHGGEWIPYFTLWSSPDYDRSPFPRWLSVYDADNPEDSFLELKPYTRRKEFDRVERCYCKTADSRVYRVRRQYGFDLLRLRQVTQTFCATFDADPAVQRALGRRLSDSSTQTPSDRGGGTVPRRSPILDTLALGCAKHRPFLPIADQHSRLSLKVFVDADRHTRVIVECDFAYLSTVPSSPRFNDHGSWRKILVHTDADAPDIQILYYPNPPLRKRKPYAPANLIPLASFSTRDGHTLGGVRKGLELLFPSIRNLHDVIHSHTPRHIVEQHIEQLQTLSHQSTTWSE